MEKNVEVSLLFSFYGKMLTDRQADTIDLYYNEDLSLSEVGAELGISRQGVHDNLSRTEAQLRNMEQKTGCVRRDQACRAAAQTILAAARKLSNHSDTAVSALAREIISAAGGLEE